MRSTGGTATEEQQGRPTVSDSVYRLLTGLMSGDGDPSSAPCALYLRLLALLGEDGFDPDQVPESVYTQLTALLSADQFDPVAASSAARPLLAALGGGEVARSGCSDGWCCYWPGVADCRPALSSRPTACCAAAVCSAGPPVRTDTTRPGSSCCPADEHPSPSSARTT